MSAMIRSAIALALSAALASPSAAQLGRIAPVLRSAPVPATGMRATLAVSPALALHAPAALSALPAPVAALAAAAPSVAAAAGLAALASDDAGAPKLGSSDSAEKAKSKDEPMWSGSAERSEQPAVAATESSLPAPALEKHSLTRRQAVVIGAAAAAAATVPASSWQTLYAKLQALPYVAPLLPVAKAAGVLVGTYYALKLSSWVVTKGAKAFGAGAELVNDLRLAANAAVVWFGGLATLWAVGVQTGTVTSAMQATGGIAALSMNKAVTNTLWGVDFLLTSPYRVGQRVEIDKRAGVISDLTLTQIVITKEDGTKASVRYQALAGKTVIVSGYQTPSNALRQFVAAAAQPRLRGALGSLLRAIDGKLIKAALLTAGLVFAPQIIAAGFGTHLLGATIGLSWSRSPLDSALRRRVSSWAKSSGWSESMGSIIGEMLSLSALVATALLAFSAGPALLALIPGAWIVAAFPYATGLSALYLTRRVETTLTTAVDDLATRNNWPLEVRVFTKLAARVATWTIGGTAAVNVAGFTWATLALPLQMTGAGAILASLPYLTSWGDLVLTRGDRERQAIGKEVTIGTLEKGVIVQKTVHHAVVRLPDGRHAMVPYATLLDAVVDEHGAEKQTSAK